jgi:hypothetical protein
MHIDFAPELDAFRQEVAVQIHGGVGTTDEVAIGHYLKRILAIDAMFGDSDYHFRKVGAR